MNKVFKGLVAGSMALASASVVAHANEAQMTEAAHQTAHIMDAVLPVLLMVAISVIARPFFKKMREARLEKQNHQDK